MVQQSVANTQIFEYIHEFSLQIIFIFVFAVKKNTNNIHIHIRSRLGIWILFLFVFVQEKIICYTPNSLIIVKKKNGGVFLKIFILISSIESYRKFLIFYARPSDWYVAVTIGLIIFKCLNIFEYLNIFVNIFWEEYCYSYLWQKMSRIIFIFIFVEYVFWEYYSYWYLFIRKIICYTLRFNHFIIF